MSDTITAYPLAWPAGWPRTTRREYSRFKTSFSAARDDLVNELRLLGGRNVVISTNVPLRQDGLPYASYKEPSDPGVAIYFTIDGDDRCIPVDKWMTTKDNLRAAQKTIAALRGLERWGAKEIVNAAFAGFQALPASTSTPGWWAVLGVDRRASGMTVASAYKDLLHRHHPDKGGDPEKFHTIQEAWSQFNNERKALVDR